MCKCCPALLVVAQCLFAAMAQASNRPDCAGPTEISAATIVRVEKNGALILRDGRAAHLEGVRLPAGSIDHFAIGISRFTNETGARYFTQRGATPLQGDYAGFHIKDPDGINVQISQR